jgi:predicted small lipoprotein YifL
MKRSAGILALGLAVFLWPACGRKGPLQPPAAREPKSVEGLTVFQRGGSIILEWTNPAKYADGRPLGPLGTAEVWLADPGPGQGTEPLTPQDFKARARLVRRLAGGDLEPAPEASSGPASVTRFAYQFSAENPGLRRLAFSVRVLDAKRRPSKFCPPVRVETRTCPLPPEILDVRVFADRIELNWAPPSGNVDRTGPASVSGYLVYRSAGGAKPEKLTPAPVPGPTFEDRRFAFEVPYTYVVRACAAGPDPCLESDDSAPREILAQDTFPPDPPRGLVALAGPGVISLSWEAGREEDLAGYRVFRKEAAESGFASLKPGTTAGLSFTDASVEPGKTYTYAVSALDKKGNESPKAESRLVSLKGNRA